MHEGAGDGGEGAQKSAHAQEVYQRCSEVHCAVKHKEDGRRVYAMEAIGVHQGDKRDTAVWDCNQRQRVRVVPLESGVGKTRQRIEKPVTAHRWSFLRWLFILSPPDLSVEENAVNENKKQDCGDQVESQERKLNGEVVCVVVEVHPLENGVGNARLMGGLAVSLKTCLQTFRDEGTWFS